MFYTTERDKMRQFYADTWRKATQNDPLDAMETRVARVIEMHPEYHAMLNNEKHLGSDYLPEMGETNPFLHMGMHLALQEQVALDRPAGIQAVYRQLGEQLGDVHDTEHAMMDCLGESLWQAQQNQGMPDEDAYLSCLQNLLKS
ncbi:DUF1841 family protein [Hydrogenovibrio thermophilus]|uniref:DUF1841 family protein n=1 Tax=Hydrogenovibrio thermophilus TaxID=265883 RepID=A0A410H2K5_9GAMM|nr:DUF1841 family protein [Hydrogenovibrio thermophilus]QAB15155.1 DUF1841 family protein [Hydrogenovibrio thermophilus]